MTELAMTEVRPSRLPSGYRFRRRIDGSAGAGFPRDAAQTAVVHLRGTDDVSVRTPLTVHIGLDPKLDLIGTHDRPGVAVDVGIAGASAAYHDGMWHVDADVADKIGWEHAFRWHVGDVHSVTVRTATRTYAVRGPRDVPLDELIEVVKSLPVK